MDFETDLSPREKRLRTDLAALARKMPSGSRLEFKVNPGEMFLNVLMLPKSQRGSGSMWLSRVIEACDRAGTPMHLNADPTDSPGDPETFDLVRWYHSFGFVPVCATEDGMLMERPVHNPQPFQKILEARAHAPRLDVEEYEKIARVQESARTGFNAATHRPSMG